MTTHPETLPNYYVYKDGKRLIEPRKLERYLHETVCRQMQIN